MKLQPCRHFRRTIPGIAIAVLGGCSVKPLSETSPELLVPMSVQTYPRESMQAGALSFSVPDPGPDSTVLARIAADAANARRLLDEILRVHGELDLRAQVLLFGLLRCRGPEADRAALSVLNVTSADEASSLQAMASAILQDSAASDVGRPDLIGALTTTRLRPEAMALVASIFDRVNALHDLPTPYLVAYARRLIEDTAFYPVKRQQRLIGVGKLRWPLGAPRPPEVALRCILLAGRDAVPMLLDGLQSASGMMRSTSHACLDILLLVDCAELGYAWNLASEDLPDAADSVRQEIFQNARYGVSRE